MQLFCPNCQAAFSGSTHCPGCGGRLLSPQESFVISGPVKLPPAEPIRPTLGGRILLGLIVTIGTSFAIYELMNTVVLLLDESADWWLTDTAYWMLVMTRVLGVMVGAMMAGAGRESGWISGTVVGGSMSALEFALATTSGDSLGWTPIALSLLYPLLGIPMGQFGTWNWAPAIPLPEPTSSSSGHSFTKLVAEDKSRRAGRPIAWFRIAIGGAIASFGIIATDDIRIWISRASSGTMQTGGGARATTVGLQIATIFLAVSGGVAGASTGMGIRHGALAGLLAFAGLMTSAAGRGGASFPAVDGFFVLIERPGTSILSPLGGAQLLGGIVVLMSAGGWLGGQLFPPLVPRYLRNRKFASQS